MSDLAKLENNIRAHLSSTCQPRDIEQQAWTDRLAENARRHDRFEELARTIVEDVLHPRGQVLVRCFSNAELADPHAVKARHVTCVFTHTLRFPATVTLNFGVGSDEPLNNLIIAYDLEILPILMTYEGHRQATFPMDAVNEDEISKWVDDQIMKFVDTYIQLEWSASFDTLVTDPVCCAQFTKALAAATESRHGVTYYFCSDVCHAQFLKESGRYVANLSRSATAGEAQRKELLRQAEKLRENSS